MARAGQKTKPTAQPIAAFLAGVDPAKREDAARLVALMAEWSDHEPVLWGAIVGFGRYHYRYASGHEGDAPLIGFAPRRAAFSIYLMGTYFEETAQRREDLLARLGRHTIGKACLYVKRLSDIDLAVLEALARLSMAGLKGRYGSTADP